MPTYTYHNNETNEDFELFQTMSEREQYLIDNPRTQQTLVHTTAHIDPIMLGRLNKEGANFQSQVIDRIAHTIPGNNMKNSRFRQNIKEI